jgi:pyruvate,water dikinase
MALLIQPLVKANVSGGGLSQNANGEMVISATWGLGSAIAQGEIVPDRYVLSRDGIVLETDAGRKNHQVDCVHGMQSVKTNLVNTPCLNATQITELGKLLRKAEDIFGDAVEIEWALDSEGIKLLQARPLCVETAQVPDEIWLQHPRLNGHPAGVGWGTGRARVVTCECQLSQVTPGDILVTSMASPAHSHVLSRVSGVVTELGGSTSHFASLARERGIPMVLGVMNATTDIPDGSTVAVDGVAGVVRWMK